MMQQCLMVVMSFTTVAGLAILRQKENNCACKNWKQAYQDGAIGCGAGQEWAWVTNSSGPPAIYNLLSNDSIKELGCKRFWERLDSDRCVNMNLGKDEGTWCYVDSACKVLNGGSGIDKQLSWKTCSAKDFKLRDYTPEELYNFSKQQDIGFGALLKLSYPGSKTGERQLVSVGDFNKEIPTWVALKLKEFGHSTTPYWFDTNKNGIRPLIIVHGSKVFKVESGPAKDPQHPGTWTALNCTMGC